MSSSKESNTAAAAEQLGAMSLGESAERTDNETEPNAENGTPTKFCSACGKKSDTVKKCTACKCVNYCDKECQNKHRKEHKKECRRIKKELDKRGGKLDLGGELDVGPLGKLSLREECPICMRVLPLLEKLSMYYACCGKTLCGGCDVQHKMKQGEQTCAFCRTAAPRTDEEVLARIRKRVELNDPQAMLNLAMHNGRGELGLPVDQAKCIDLLRQCAGLGYPPALFSLGNFHETGEMGLERNNEEALKYYEKAAEEGDVYARHNLACKKKTNGDHVAAMRYWRMSAPDGSKRSMAGLIECFEDGLLHHANLAETLQAFYRSRFEMASEDRNKYIAYLKMKGEYRKEYYDTCDP